MSTLPFTVQDDLKAKEEYASQQQRKSNYCGSRKIRLWSLILFIFTSTLLLVNYVRPMGHVMIEEDIMVQDNTLKTEINGLIQQYPLVVFSKTYCPYSQKAKQILSLYDLKEPFKVIEVNLRDDDYQVKMTLNEISGRDTFPNIFLNGQTIGGSDQLEELHISGQLALLLKKNQLLKSEPSF